MSVTSPRSLLVAAAISATALAGAAPAALARHGADDPAGHNAGDHHGGRAKVTHRAHRARHGADDPAGHQRRGRGTDDGPNHR